MVAYSGLGELPRGRVVVIDGSAIPAGAADRTPEGIELHTLLGQLAYRLGGPAAYEHVAAQDQALLGSGTAQLAELLEAHAPCLVLLDETLEYLNKALSVASGDGNLAATTLTLIKELCSAAANVPNAAVLATLTSSRLEDYATLAGEEMQERLSKVVGRSENIVTPVEGDDIFPILHRRLFETVGNGAQRQAVGGRLRRVLRVARRRAAAGDCASPATASGSPGPTRFTPSSSTFSPTAGARYRASSARAARCARSRTRSRRSPSDSPPAR